MNLQRFYIYRIRQIIRKKVFLLIPLFILIILLSVFLLKPHILPEKRVRILKINIDSLITSDNLNIDRLIDDLEGKNYDGILFVLNSPGGNLDILRIVNTLESIDTPKFCYINGEATSAAYWLCVHSDYIIARPDSIVGSIGAYIEVIDISKLLDKIGINVSIIKSTPYKDIGSGYRPLTEFELEYLKRVVERVTDDFVRDIASRRNISNNISLSGLWFLAKDAKDMNLIDDIGEYEKMLDYISKFYNTSKENIVFINKEYKYKKPWYSNIFNFRGFIEEIASKVLITKIFI
ncbi:S49 family peptidase [Nanoarchaeota archaeon NZ13-N]|nr:MAG: S49 family peptidase [Nanoarchaeota archaeon NZ13-N]